MDFFDNINFDALQPLQDIFPDGKVTLERTESGNSDTFKMYNKDGGQYVYEGGKWIRIDGSGTVTIKGVKYDKV